MSNEKPRILVMGATGLVGKAVLNELRQKQNIEVVAATRSPQKWSRADVTAIYLDLDKKESLGPALEGVDRLFMVTGYTVDMLRQSKDLIHAAKRAGVKHIVHLGACGDDETSVGHWAWHQFIERYIEWSGFSFTHLRPEAFMQNFLGYGGENYVKNGVIRHYVGDTRLSWVDVNDIAALAAESLLEPDVHHGKIYRMGYEALTCKDIADIFTSVYGQPFRYESRPPEEFLRGVLAAGAEPAYMQCVYESFVAMAEGRFEKCDETFDNFERIMGRKPKTMTEFARNNWAKFRYNDSVAAL